MSEKKSEIKGKSEFVENGNGQSNLAENINKSESENTTEELFHLKEELDFLVNSSQDKEFKKDIQILLSDVNLEIEKGQTELTAQTVEKMKERFDAIKIENKVQLNNLESNILKDLGNDEQIKMIADRGRAKESDKVKSYLSDLETKMPWLSGLIKRAKG